MYTLTEKLRRFRKEKGLTQQMMGEMLSMEQTTYSKIELGKSSLRLDVALQIAAIIKKDIHEFVILPPIRNEKNLPSLERNLTKSEPINESVKEYEKIHSSLEELILLMKRYFKDS